MNDGRLLIFGGTSDARLLCERLDAQGVRYRLSVATAAGRQQAAGLQGEIREGRMDAQAMAEYCRCHGIRLLADLSHPYAAVLSDTILQVQRELGIPLVRYNRPSDIDAVDNPLIYKTDSIDNACEIAMTLGQRVLLTTGSKQLADYIARLPGKTVLARVLPTQEVLAQCESYGMTIDQIFALKGPFSAEFNEAFYRYCGADVVITKESGTQGGFSEKVAPCLALGIPCIVVVRPQTRVSGDVTELQDLCGVEQYLTSRFSVC
ncbi:cobalt-precorrin-6A reductase [Morganella morganii]|uniref:cobalt-precorrin-6A reductase n=1 Tax=Morganella morganii TaxID=582 RepID=UPI001BD9BE76|nr:cobalt-precorrin-6A reductase [Morganella morganii]ELT0455498.1 cobalt-precorrin-6A reductase [Morganella morganii]MBT0338467.1 cobalt-precorrin-6A reductase [Morganella morganii subsp. morganii]MBT0382076.1 cobalt-precorrin-6A reductase [Morganella morganii subsp. morganii]MBT0420812.1 cobalt-precorrin-6A reductase [Morganella morganii subsp. morganii]MBT0515154.1 cobalt-precorrin-6A reductase [Morganella morganii subsp. morganii]